MRLDRKSIHVGQFICLDAAGVEPVYIKQPPAPPAPPSYGSQPFAEVSAKLDAAKQNLDQILQKIRDARRR